MLLFFLAGSQLKTARGAAQVFEPKEIRGQRWRVSSFLNDVGLLGRNVFTLDFQEAPGQAGPVRVWVATSDGLMEYDGYAWRRHGKAEGLPSDFVRCVKVVGSGELWVGTDTGAGVYDGKRFLRHGSDEGLAGPNVRRIMEDPDGTLWFCSDSWPNANATGGITSLRNGVWRAYRAGDGLPSDYVVNYFRDSAGERYAVTLKGVVRLVGERWVEEFRLPADTRSHLGSGVMAEVPSLGLVLSTGLELFVRTNGVWRLHPAKEVHKHGIVRSRDGALVSVVTAGQGMRRVAELVGDAWDPVSAAFAVPRSYIEDLKEAPDGSIWVVGFECLVRWERQGNEWREFQSVERPRFVDDRGAVWFFHMPQIGLGAGPVVHADGRWVRHGGQYLGVVPGTAGRVWGWSTNGVMLWAGEQERWFGAAETGIARVVAGGADGGGRFWLIGFSPEGLGRSSVFGPAGWSVRRFADIDSLVRVRASAPYADGLCVVSELAAGTEFSVFRVSGASSEYVPVPRELISDFRQGMMASERPDAMWLFGDSGLFRWERGRAGWQSMTNTPGKTVVGVVRSGVDLWFGSAGITGGRNGLARFRDGRWSGFTTPTIQSMTVGKDGTVYAGHDGSFTMVSGRAGPLPCRVSMPAAEVVDGIVADAAGRIWLGDGETVYRFAPDGMPPETRVTARDTRVLQGGTVVVEAEGISRFLARGEGPPHQFSWRVDGGGWTDFSSEPFFRLSTEPLSPGGHRVEVRARDAGLEVDASPAMLSLEVYPIPLQNRSWFLPMVGGVVLAMCLLSASAVRARRQLAVHAAGLEETVEARTAQLKEDMERREKAEKALIANERRLNLALDAAQMGTWDRDLASQELRWSTTLERLNGFEPGEFPGTYQAFFDLVHPEDRPILASAQRAARENGGDYHVELRFVLRDGRVRWGLLRGKLVFGPAGIPERIFGVEIDITERKRAEAALRESEERLRTVMGSINEVVWVAEPTGHRRTYLSPAFEKVWGWTSEEVLADPEAFLGTVMEEDRGAMLADIRRRLEGEATAMEYRVRRKDGRLVWIWDQGFPIRDGSGRLVAINGICADITERKDAEQAIRARLELEERLSSIASTLPGGIFACRLRRDGSVGLDYVSPKIGELTGVATGSAAFDPASVWSVVDPEDLNGLKATLVEARARMRPWAHTFRVTRPDGMVVWIEGRSTPLAQPDGSQVWHGILLDVSERKRAEVEHARMEELLRQSQKMEALGVLAGGVAHDFNNVLGSILGNVELALADVGKGHPSVESLEEIRRSGLRAKSLVQQILLFSRKQYSEPRVLSLTPVLRECVTLIRATLPASVEIRSELAADVPRVLADPNQIHQVVMNLCTNAWHAMEGAHGVLTVRLERLSLAGPTRIGARELPEGEYAALSVADTGTGISPAHLARIFDPFFTTKAPGKGTGLGLAVVHGIVEGHGGAVSVSSVEGKGSTFRLVFPATRSTEAVEEILPPLPAKVVAGRGERVLFLDDEEALVSLAVRSFTRFGYQIHPFTRPEQALAAFLADPGGFDVVVTDMNMRGLSGIDFSRKVLERDPTARVVLTSGFITDDIKERALALGVARVVYKPSTARELCEVVYTVLEEAGRSGGRPGAGVGLT